MSAKELREDIERTSRLISEDKEQLKKPGKNYIFSQIDQELAQYLEDIRLGKISVDEET
jgi:predicted RNA-binding protein with PIN domain